MIIFDSSKQRDVNKLTEAPPPYYTSGGFSVKKGDSVELYLTMPFEYHDFVYMSVLRIPKQLGRGENCETALKGVHSRVWSNKLGEVRTKKTPHVWLGRGYDKIVIDMVGHYFLYGHAEHNEVVVEPDVPMIIEAF